MTIMTLCFIRKNGKILLGMKKRGLGNGRWNGFGGKLHDNETIEDAVRREVMEEARIVVNDITKQGILRFKLENMPGVTLEVHIFSTSTFSGEPVETEEMKPQWFNESELPFDSMWRDDPYWFPLLLENKRFRGEIRLDKNDTVIHHTIDEADMI